MKIYKSLFDQIISPESLFSAWDAFKSDKRKKKDVRAFEWRLEQNIFQLHRELKNKTYKHSTYEGFYIRDPKQRHVHKASVRDRVLHHAIFSVINPIFEKTFIATSFSCRIGFGNHEGVKALERMVRKISANGTRPCFILKCDIQKFFDSVNHGILLSIIRKRIKDEDAMRLFKEVVESFSSPNSILFEQRGLPIGNLTSQLFANIYMNEFDQFVKHDLKVKNYARYTDDFVVVAEDQNSLETLLARFREFLERKLALKLHPKKVGIHKFHNGIDFLGYVVFSKHRLVRSKTKRRMIAKLKHRLEEYKLGKIEKLAVDQSLQSYLGVLSHANAKNLADELKNGIWFLG
ncbi:MAG: hypothetical protein A3B25_00585 [Candidatus Ryanbacteria bacterium RIFCSPLOWO2_01_FULL_48_26]|uniref:Reverse transcriptase domain-containing protein n=1 Tax=Candidatus Ryanbacteria bacterium RIFCSPLOWO2_01_FULL_48_26 TaxID=1802126 RepID=A0A1G2GTP7_9BACT|nr:MAG: hypothetical protein A3B25_00585 [Candidatus Ryanbacteria bacterium RIFCSPLOWO2_01_FULL_48_26]